MRSSRTFASPVLQTDQYRSLRVFLRFRLPHLPRWFGHLKPKDSITEGGNSFEPGHERFAGAGYYSITEQDHDLEKLVENKTLMLMTIINR